ncbi:MAG: tRNA(Ile)(2)-agmatinylcytidine synthase [Candidatus Bathyarchaeota archaeon]|nr:tRNA(Ile)(2)-agmatinylcytidine synthase [Candidatus Bathyarchaeota archaeon]
MNLHIGFDDTDSPRGGCTTYVAALMIERFCRMGVQFADYPNLIRLNPNAPWKTRGNGALCLRVICEDSLYEDVREQAIEVIEENSDLSYRGTDPGAVFLIGDVPEEVRRFAKETIQGIVNMKYALKIIRKFRAEAVGYNSRRGIIGGLAAIGETLSGDHTFELIAYRSRENWGSPRKIDKSSVIEMDKKMANLTFNNIDPETGRILITPRGPDPVLYGIRGETPEAVKCAHSMIRSYEPVERWVIFRTNHGTDAHLRRVPSIKDVRAYHPVILEGRVVGDPKIIPGGHVIFRIQDDTGTIDCAVYEQGGSLRNIAKDLIDGDIVEVYGGVRPPSKMKPMTINVEKLRVVRLAEKIIYQNPLCPLCGKRMKSMGRNKGFECYRCGFHGPELRKIEVKVNRALSPGLYFAPLRSERHLTKPPSRYGLKKRGYSQVFSGVIPYSVFWGKGS